MTLANGKPGDQYNFNWTKPGFPGTIIAGRYVEPFIAGPGNVKVYLTIAHQASGNQLAQTAQKEFEFFTDNFGEPESSHLNVVEIPDDTLPAVWAPELAAIMGSRTGDKSGIRLLANTIAHQWWGSEVSPKNLNDTWITNGMCRYGELMYLQDEQGENALRLALQDVAASALAYDTTPLSPSGREQPFSPEFQSQTFDKGAEIFHMLRWEIGDKDFLATLKGVLSQYTDQGITTSDVAKVAEAQSQQQLTPFFAQWVDGTGAPTFTDKYAVYRLGNNKGFRTIGEIDQNLDLFRMPVDLRVETDGKTVNEKVDVVGDNSNYAVDTFGRPRRITIDPNDWVLKSSPDQHVRIDILKGQQLVAQGDLVGALNEYNEALKTNPESSLASYRIGEVLFQQHNFQAAVNSYRDALRGDDDPAWTEVWSHIELGPGSAGCRYEPRNNSGHPDDLFDCALMAFQHMSTLRICVIFIFLCAAIVFSSGIIPEEKGLALAQLFGHPEGEQPGKRRFYNVVRVGGSHLFRENVFYPGHSSSARTPPPAINPVPGEAGFKRTFPAPNFPIISWGIVPLTIGTVTTFFLASSMPLEIASATSFAYKGVADMTITVANNDNGVKTEPAPAFYNFSHAVDVDQLVF